MDDDQTRSARIANLNDQFRKHQNGNGRVLITQGIQALGGAAMMLIVAQVQAFDEFSEDNDPHGERDFGAFDFQDQKIFFKIDVFDSEEMLYGSEEPDNPEKSYRVMTILLASEY